MTDRWVLCQFCAYWDRIEKDTRVIGHCRRYAPRATLTELHFADAQRSAVFPITFADDYCGDGVRADVPEDTDA